ncbi:histidine phosphatase family protein [uncultured Tateyamaria sp.]|uniref:histidine phosphatase family protein n=1 Tax=Tateyamaria sp. 1078 TaxID=3417464 RepID=UPI0026258C0D|nr:histidine phosphatase family protein [uncultured Tateyamaria sp.]
MPKLIFVTHPEVVVDPDRPVTDWTLRDTGRARATAFASHSAVADVTHIWTSAERKARETADILAARRGIPVATHADLGENDRSATGFLPPDQFEAAADMFFAQPGDSFRGWETAQAAQARVVGATQTILSQHAGTDLMIVAHGAVGTLLWCHLTGSAISRDHDQPRQGCYWVANLPDLTVHGPWQPIAP